MSYLLFAFFLFVCCYIMLKIPFFTNSGLSRNQLLVLFLVKISAGVALGVVCSRYYPVNDYFILNDEGIKENGLLINDPADFFKSIFHSPYDNKYGGFFNSVGSYWNDLRNNIIIKILAILDLFTRGNYFSNSVFFSLFGFFGHVALFRVFSNLYPDKKTQIIIGCFFIPTTLYFSSGIHKDLVIFTFLGLFCYALYFLILENFSFGRMILITFSFLTLLLMRNYLAVVLIPFSIGFVLCEKKNWKPMPFFGVIIISGLILLIITECFFPSIQPLQIISQKQHDFLDLHKAASQIDLTELKPELKSFLNNLPEALNHGFLRPYIWEGGGRFSLLMAIELMLVNIMVVFSVFNLNKSLFSIRPFIAFVICTCIIMFVFTGYIVPNTSSIIRYKSLYLPLIITPMLCLIPRKKTI